MEEIYEFRIPEGWALEWLDSKEGKRNSTGSVRIVTTRRECELFGRILSIHKQRMRVGERLFLSWAVRRVYEQDELDAAELFVLRTSNIFEPPGEELGCVYLPDVDGPAEADNRVGSLVLQCSRFRGRSYCESIAGERLVGPELQTFARENALSGVRFGTVLCTGADRSNSGWAELIVTSKKVLVTPPTLAGDGLVDFSSIESHGDRENLGLNVLSEVFIERESWDGSDFVVSKQTVGAHQGLLRPYRILFVSKRLFSTLSPKMRRGLIFEIARFTRSGRVSP
jgi:hypothetical protein